MSYTEEAAAPGEAARLRVGKKLFDVPDPSVIQGPERADAIKAFQTAAANELKSVGYPEKADPAQINRPLTIAILTLLVIYVTMVYGPIAAMLVELFPARIRYTSMSLPYHIGNGWFGGFLPTSAFAIVAATGNSSSGLWYPVIVALGTVVIGALLLPETRDRRIND